MSVRETKARTAAKGAKTEPKRIRVNVPVADESVLAWFELQENHSLSVRQLIRESIERYGYVDIVNRPVAQLPKRGRPPVQGEEGFQATGAEQQPAEAAAETGRIQSRADEARTERAPGLAELDLSEPESGGPELLGIALQVPALVPTPPPGEKVQQAPDEPTPADPAPPSGGQQEVNDIFASLRG